MQRNLAIDWMRGVVIMIMTLDHSAIFHNPGRLHSDSAATYVPGTVIGWDQFFTRWITHLCAPTFLFLAGSGLALSLARNKKNADRELLIRGLFIVSIDVVWMSALSGQRPMLQVLYAIGGSFICMIAVRRAPLGVLFAASLAWFAFGELVTLAAWDPHGKSTIFPALFVARHVADGMAMFYPLIPWLCMMLLGWCFGHYLHKHGDAAAQRLLVIAGVASLAVFALVRGLNGYGNMALLRDDGSLLQWLNVSKYPPSLTYVALELGIAALLLSASFWLRPRDNNPVLVFGQTALFYYVLHHMTLIGLGRAFSLDGGTLRETYLAMVLAWIVLYPICFLYRRYKRAHPHSIARFL